ncbi:unnamed protein product, partial [marine sediment metagenome]
TLSLNKEDARTVAKRNIDEALGDLQQNVA